MMDTILNLGMNDDMMLLISRVTNNSRFALDTYRRFLQMYGNVVLGVDKSKYDDVLAGVRAQRNVTHDSELDEKDLMLGTYTYTILTSLYFIYHLLLNRAAMFHA